MGKFLLLFMLVLLVAGGGVGGWWFGIRGEPIPGMGDGEDRVVSMKPTQSEYVELKPLSIPVMQEGRVTQLLTMVVSLEVAGESGLEAVAGRRPRLRDAMLSELHGLYAYSFVRERKDKMQLIKLRLLKAGRELLGDQLRGVHIQAIQGRDVSS